MSATPSVLDTLDRVITDSVQRGLGHRVAEDERLDGRHVRLDGRDLVNFGSCSYLGLELDPRLKAGAIDAVERYGTEVSSSRVFLSAPMYEEVEEQLETLFGGHIVLAPTTTLAHFSALPTLVGPRDAVVLDHQVHNSIQMAARLLQASGIHLELVRHSRLDLLEERVVDLAQSHDRVWYMADGVFSMYGDCAPVEALRDLLDRREQMRLYIDDAHGMSCFGEHGRGYVLSRIALHPQMVLATGLAKGFGTGGGVLIFSDPEPARRVRTCGGPMLFSGPLQPAVLGAIRASAAIHLSDEISQLQQALQDRIALCNARLGAAGLPVLSSLESPIRFVGLGSTRAAQNLTARLMEEGFFTNVAQFPAVAMTRAGSRFLLNLHHRQEDIEGLVDAISRHFEPALEDAELDPDSVWSAFRLTREAAPAPERRSAVRSDELSGLAADEASPAVSRLRIERHDSIDALDGEEWDRCLGDRGSFTASALRLLERTFPPGAGPERAWTFHYYRVVDTDGATRLLTFFTEALWKADMLASASVSREVERLRKRDPLALTHRVFGMGSLLTEGDHLYLDPALRGEGGAWKECLALLLEAVREDSAACDASMVALRDLSTEDVELREFLEERDFLCVPLPESMHLDVSWRGEKEFLAGLSPGARRHQRRRVSPWNDAYAVEVLGADTRRPSESELAHFHHLYRNVKERSLALNTFELPVDLFADALFETGWELLVLRPADRAKGVETGTAAVGMLLAFAGRDHYVPLVVGLDYPFVESRGLYRQCLRHAALRARKLGLHSVRFGFGAALEKRRFGAQPHPQALYVQADDPFAIDAVAQLSLDAVD